MNNQYRLLKSKHEKEFNQFPMFFAFSNKQFAEGMEKLGLNEDDTDKIYSIGGGGYIRREDSKLLDEMIERHSNEMEKAISEDTDGTGFIYDMFTYEFENHEVPWTYDIEPALDALGMSLTYIISKPNLAKGYKLAIRAISKIKEEGELW